MQTFTLTMSNWVRRLIARNPLVRASDRLEAASMLAVLVAMALVVPFAGALGTAIYDSRAHAFAFERSGLQQVEATAVHDSAFARLPYDASHVTALQWNSAGRTHTDVVNTEDNMKAGQRTLVWVDDQGTVTTHPRTDEDAAAEAVIGAFVLWATVAGVGVAAVALMRRALNKARYAAWDRALDDLANERR
jgi:hypothetical protein